MTNVIAFKPKEAEHLSGKARCCACRHEWVAVALVGADWLKCPACGLMKGRYVYKTYPPVGSLLWQCGCGCDVFFVTNIAVFCIHCGLEQEFK